MDIENYVIYSSCMLKINNWKTKASIYLSQVLLRINLNVFCCFVFRYALLKHSKPNSQAWSTIWHISGLRDLFYCHSKIILQYEGRFWFQFGVENYLKLISFYFDLSLK